MHPITKEYLSEKQANVSETMEIMAKMVLNETLPADLRKEAATQLLLWKRLQDRIEFLQKAQQ